MATLRHARADCNRWTIATRWQPAPLPAAHELLAACLELLDMADEGEYIDLTDDSPMTPIALRLRTAVILLEAAIGRKAGAA